MYKLIKPIAFLLDPEVAHDRVIGLISRLELLGYLLGRNKNSKKLSFKVGSNTWSFPIGLAAGLDKNGSCYNFFSNLGFGAIEVGTVTPLAQVGNPKPRMFRYIQERSLRNSMGFNNKGAASLLENTKVMKRCEPLGINIGKNKLTDDEMAFKDYKILYDKFKNIADYIVINISSPNTPGLRDHQSKHSLEKILQSLDHSADTVDLYVKISPELDLDIIPEILETLSKYKLTGIIATNTTVIKERGAGGISGDLLFEKARTVRQRCLSELKKYPALELIGVGGFSSFDQIKDFWKQGGGAVQIYSAFIFQGPDILKDIQSKLLCDMRKLGANNFEEYLLKIREN